MTDTPTQTDLALAREALQQAKEALALSQEATRIAARLAHECELAVLDLDGQGDSPRANWLRCHLDGDGDGCAYWLTRMYPERVQSLARDLELARAAVAEVAHA